MQPVHFAEIRCVYGAIHFLIEENLRFGSQLLSLLHPTLSVPYKITTMSINKSKYIFPNKGLLAV